MSYEIWKPIDQRYEISSLGRIKGTYKGRAIILKNNLSSQGYEIVCMCISDVRKYATVHRLMAKHFLNLSDETLVVNHKDGDKTNNMLYNLEVCTQSYNRKHSFFGKKRFVSFNTKYNKFKVDIRDVDRKQKFFGYFENEEKAYEVAKAEYFKMYNKFPWSIS